MAIYGTELELHPAAGSPEVEPRRLSGHPTRGLSVGRPGAGLVVGGVFVVVGAVLAMVGEDVIRVGPRSFHAPRRMVTLIGGIFALVGLLALVGAVGALRRRVRQRELAERYPRRPWLADYPWDDRGISDDRLREIRQTFAFAVFWCVFLVPFHWLAALEGACIWAFLSLFDLAGLAMLGYGVYLVLRHRKYGTSRLEFGRFPFFVGERVELGFTNGNIGRYERMTFTLRCIRERVVTTGTGRNRSTKVVCEQLYGFTWETAGGGELNWASGPVPVRFDIPADVPGTHLAARPPRYWELEVAAETPGVDFLARFLVPVYARAEDGPASGATVA